MNLEDRIVGFVHSRGSVSFAEFKKHFGEEFDGDLTLFLGDLNVILWINVSRDFSEALVAAMGSKRIQHKPAPFLVYFIDGICLDLPLAKRPPKSGYKKPHWCPVVFDPMPVG